VRHDESLSDSWVEAAVAEDRVSPRASKLARVGSRAGTSHSSSTQLATDTALQETYDEAAAASRFAPQQPAGQENVPHASGATQQLIYVRVHDEVVQSDSDSERVAVSAGVTSVL
jgi:hypothetical protein